MRAVVLEIHIVEHNISIVWNLTNVLITGFFLIVPFLDFVQTFHGYVCILRFLDELDKL